MRTLIGGAALCWMVVSQATAPPYPYVTIRLAQNVSVQLPGNWQPVSENSRLTLEASVVARSSLIRELDARSELAFAANYYDDRQRTAGIFNIRYYPDQTVRQDDVRSLDAAGLRGVDAEAEREMRVGLAAAGMEFIEWRGVTRREINRLSVLVCEYRRRSRNGIFRVRLARVLDAARSFTVTVSYREDQGFLLEPIAAYIVSTIRRE